MVDFASDAAAASAAPAADQPRGLVRYVSELDDELFAFQREAFPTRRADLVEPRWRWMFQRSAERLGIEPRVWLYRGKQGILAQQGVIPVRLHTRAGECGTGWFVETMVLEQARGKAVGPMLVAKAKQDLPFNLSLGQTAQMRELQYGLGWKRVAPLGKLVFALRGRVALAGKVPDSVAPVAGMALITWQRLRSWPARLQSRSTFTTRPVTRFGPSHDRLWERVRSAYAVAVVRDGSYLNWKYVEQPGQSFTRLEVICDGDVIAVVVISIAEPDRAYRSRRAILTDMVVMPDNDQHVWAALEATRQYASECGADVISLEIINPALVQRALAFGFARRDPSRVLLIATEDPPSSAGRLALDGENWLVTRGDSDIDRPW